MALHTQVYQVPIVFQDLHSVEGLLQMFDSLEYLDSVVNDIFNKIRNRVIEEKNKINDIDGRVRLAQGKINTIRGTNRATTVLSPHRYPGPEVERLDYVPLYHDVPLHLPEYNEYDFPDNVNQHANEPIDDVLGIRQNGMLNKRKKPMDVKEGLGRLPEHLPSVSSLILFNSTENPYKNYSTLDNLLGVDKEARKVQKKNIAGAPKTLVEGDVLPSAFGLNIGYVPKLGTIPSLDIPSLLPGLPGVADISFDTSGLVLPSIAPSAENNLTLPSTDGWVETKNLFPGSLPNVSAPSSNSGPPPPPPSSSSSSSTATTAPPPPPPAASSGGPPPPPPPSAGPPPPPPPAVNAPPPPPPPVAPALDDDDFDADKGGDSGGDGGGGGGDVRSSLMDAIRGAGLKSLKKVSEEDLEKKEAPPAKSGGGAGLMGDLMATLQLRRKGISGNNDTKKKGKATAGGGDDDGNDDDDWS